ncbi:hypothetical protein B0H66DRAFT_272339 [Apodospora peruviana]|uniref:Uncharacterized protein n=1 Tax=Apodospora peruviana TaxID=516989 RepID=A0AAE0M1R6_9PEZI|nr:hypothetical protein B0H66DRAFT_272339 [Apodospora peruviana]
MVGIALLGAGIFAKEEHLPAIQAASTSGTSLKAVYSRSQKSAEALASFAGHEVDIYFDSPSTDGGKSLDDLLRRDDIDAVVVALPILAQPAVIEKALRAGKHVLSEKPVAGDLDAARRLLGWYESNDGLASGRGKPIWAVAENFRFIAGLEYAAAQVKEVGGKLVTFRLQMNSFVKPENKYFNTEWRKVPDYQGGFLLDGGVHFIAGLRLLLAAAGGQEIKQLAGFSGLLEERLPPVDTVHAVAVTQDGKSGTIGISFGTEFKSGLEVEIVTTNGAVIWNPKLVKTMTRGDGDEKAEAKKDFGQDSGVKAEVEAFVKSIVAGKNEVDSRQSPLEALKDLEIIQRLLESGEGGASVKTLEGK